MTESVDLTRLAADIVAAYVVQNRVSAAELPTVIASVRAALSGTEAPAEAEAPASEIKSRAEIRKSITPDALISFLDGRPYKTLKRHLTGQGLTLAEYRERFGLPDDYPSSAPNYSAQRSEMAKAMGLGGKRAEARARALQVEADAAAEAKAKAEARDAERAAQSAPEGDVPAKRAPRRRKAPEAS